MSPPVGLCFILKLVYIFINFNIDDRVDHKKSPSNSEVTGMDTLGNRV